MHGKKRKLVYISGEDFFDVDFPVLKILNEYFDLVWIPILRINGWYSLNEIQTFSQENNIDIIPIVQKFKYKDPRMLMLYLNLLRRVKQQNPDIVYFEYFGVPFLHYITPLFLDKKKIVLAIHDVKQHYKMAYGKLKTFYFASLFKRFVNFQVFSQSQLEIFKSKYPNKNVFTANLCLKDFGVSRVRRNEKGKVKFLFFGIIRKNKGLNIIIEAVNELSKRRKDFTVVVAGDAKDWKEYEENISDKTPYELYIRKISNNEIPDLFKSSHYVLLPYIDVTQSGVLLTAYNYNVPAIASDLPGFNEYIVNNVNGYLVTPNKENLIDKMEHILNTHACNYQTICSNLQDYVSNNISSRKIVKEYTTFFNSL